MIIDINMNNKIPVMLINGEDVTLAVGIKAFMEYKTWSKKDMAHYLKVSTRTIDGWLQGRNPHRTALLALSYMLN